MERPCFAVDGGSWWDGVLVAASGRSGWMVEIRAASAAGCGRPGSRLEVAEGGDVVLAEAAARREEA